MTAICNGKVCKSLASWSNHTGTHKVSQHLKCLFFKSNLFFFLFMS